MSDRELYLGAMAGEYEGELPPPSSRSLKWMAKILGQEVETEPVQSPEEAYLKEIAESGGGGGVTPSGSINIVKNNTYDVSEYAEAVVNVANSYASSDAGKVVRISTSGHGTLIAQSAVTKTGVGTYSTIYNNQVTFQLAALSSPAAASDIAEGKTAYGADGSVITGTASGGGGGNPNYVETVEGTLENPWGSINFGTLAQALLDGEASALIEFDASALGAGVTRNDARAEGAAVSLSGANVVSYGGYAYKIIWDSDGAIASAYMMNGNGVQDVSAYASRVPSTMTVTWHPLPDDGE